MKFSIDKLIIGLILLAFTLATAWLNKDTDQTQNTHEAKKMDPDYRIEDFTTTAFDDKGNIKYEIIAAQMTHYPFDDSALFSEPKLTQYQPDRSRVVTTAKRGRLTPDHKTIVMSENVRQMNSAGVIIRAKELRINIE